MDATKQPPAWMWDELRQLGRDYGEPAEVEAYDPSHADFRDIERESDAVLDAIGVAAGQVLIDFGSGTGTFAIQAARRGARVHAVDVSPAMLAHARSKAARAGVSNIEFHHAGFLTYAHAGLPADAISTTFAFHHLPDLWKGVALERMRDMLKPGGRLHMHDVIVEQTGALEKVRAFVDRQAAAGGDFLREDAEGHFREELSTYDWVMDGLFERAGFTIDRKHIEHGVLGTYLCTHASGRGPSGAPR